MVELVIMGTKTVAETKPKKRRVKDPETFRERAQRASEADVSAKPKRLAKARESGKKVTSPIFRPISKVGRFLVPTYFRNSWAELKQVSWPKFGRSLHLTFAVIVFAVVIAATVAAIDFGLDKIFKALIIDK